MSDKKTPQEEYVPRVHLPRSSLREIECPLGWNPAVDYHILEEIKRYEDHRKSK